MSYVRQSRVRAGWLSALGIAALSAPLAGCNPGKFEPYAENAPIRVHAAPGSYGFSGYGRVLTTYYGDVGGAEESRVIASAGAATPIVFGRAWNGASISDRAFLRCKGKEECPWGSDVGATLIPFGTWGGGLGRAGYGCVYAPSNAVIATAAGLLAAPGGQAYIVCESDKHAQYFGMGLDAVQGDSASLQFSGFGLPAGHPLGVVLLGIHVLDNRTSERRSGGLYHQPDRVNEVTGALPPERVPLVDPATGEPFSDDPAVGDFGRHVVGVAGAAGALTIAIAQPSRQRVIVASYEPSLPGAELEKLRVRACIDAPDASLRGFGERLAIGDVTGDGAPELFVGVDPLAGVEAGREALYMFGGSGLPAIEDSRFACPAWKTAAQPIVCVQQAGRPSCAGAAFGAALAVGDVNGDGAGDLMVGAPLADVEGVSDAGAVWIVPGASTGLDTARALVLTAPAARDAQFGASVAALRTRQRDEPVIAAPGINEIFVFMCTPLETGFGGAHLCLE